VRLRRLSQPQAPAANEDLSVSRNHVPDQLRNAHKDDHQLHGELVQVAESGSVA
jgi:hypothetical protein